MGRIIGLCAVVFCLARPTQAGELDELLKGVTIPTKTQAQNPQGQAVSSAPPSGVGVGNLLKERTEKVGQKWVQDFKVRDVLTDYPTSPVFITQLIMNATMPSVGDVFAKAINQGQQAAGFQRGTLGSLSTMLSGAGEGEGSSVESTRLAACLNVPGVDPQACMDDPTGTMSSNSVGSLKLMAAKLIFDPRGCV